MKKLFKQLIKSLNISNQYRKEIAETMAGHGFIHRL
jgi:hypothetical protein